MANTKAGKMKMRTAQPLQSGRAAAAIHSIRNQWSLSAYPSWLSEPCTEHGQTDQSKKPKEQSHQPHDYKADSEQQQTAQALAQRWSDQADLWRFFEGPHIRQKAGERKTKASKR